WSGVVGRDDAAQQGRYAEELEGVPGDETAVELFGAFAGRRQHVFAPAADDVVEDVVLFLIIEEFRRLKSRAAARAAAAGIVNLNHGDAIGVDVGERIQQDVLNDAED